MSPTPEFTDAQLLAARATAWHQAGEPLITLEAARSWVNNFGLVLFAPRAQTLGAPAPSLVEATQGKAMTAATAAESELAQALVARMVTEGSAIPLNLLGGPGDAADFVASAQVFSFCYTLRGDKAWKQPPAQTGGKVSTLALRVFETLTERGAMTASALASELGREVTDTAIVRALGELWAQLRVLPHHAADASGTIWELATQRFTKAIKAGSNAGLPTALSALVSLYLHQAISASEDEVEAFLSPLTARSRIREVVNALSSARELETVVIAGKTLLYVADALPEFAPEAASEEATPDTEAAPVEDAGGEEGRISRFRSTGTRGGDLRGKPFRPAAGAGASKRSGSSTGPRRGSDATERPARKTGFGAAGGGASNGERPSAFTRPWDEGKPERTAGSPSEDRPKRPFRPRADPGDRPYNAQGPFRRDQSAGEGRPARPFRPRAEGEDARPKRTFRPVGEGGAAGRTFRPGAGRSDGPARPYTPRPYASRPAAGDGASFPGAGERKTFRPRADREEGRDSASARPGDPRPKRNDAAGASERPWKARSAEDRPRSDRPYTPRTDRPFTPRSDRPFTPRSDRPFTPRSDRPFTPRAGEGEERRPRPGGGKFAKPGGSERRFTPRERPSGGFGGDSEGGGGAPRGSKRFGPPSGDRPERSSFPRAGAPRAGGFRAAGASGPSSSRPFGARPSGPRPSSPRAGGSGFGGSSSGGSNSKPFGARPGGSRPGFSRPSGPRVEGARGDGPSGGRAGGAFRPAKPGFGKRPGGFAGSKPRPGGSSAPRAPRPRRDAPEGGA